MNEHTATVLSDWPSYSRDLKQCGYSPDVDFVCPICGETCSCPTKPISVSKGHIIPAAFGGISTVLVCKQCEDFMGHSIEAPLIKLVKDGRAIYGRADGIVRGRFRIKTDTGPAHAHLRFSGNNGWTIHFPKPGDMERVFPDAKPGPIVEPPRLEFALAFDKPRVDRSLRLTVLKVAYLASFKWLGYAYVLRRELAWVGKKLRGQPVDRPYVYSMSLPGKAYTLRMPGYDQLALRESHVALFSGTAAELPVLLGFVQLQNMQHLAVLPPPAGGVTLEQLRDKLGTGDGRTAYVAFDPRPAVIVV